MDAQNNFSARYARACRTIEGCMQGPLLDHFRDPRTVELAANPNGTLWVEKLGDKMRLAYDSRQNAQTWTQWKERMFLIISCVAGVLGAEVNYGRQYVEGEFPLDGSRFEGWVPPAVAGPSFTLRKKATQIYTLAQYVEGGVITAPQLQVLEQIIRDKRNILVAGGTGSGKTTLINALIQKFVEMCPEERPGIIEDTGELQCSAQNMIALHSGANFSMSTALRTMLRARPDRIIVGEVRGSEGYDLLAAWNTGHDGGFATIHANSAAKALEKFAMFCTASPECPRRGLEDMIASTVGAVVFIKRDRAARAGRVLQEVARPVGFDGHEFKVEPLGGTLQQAAAAAAAVTAQAVARPAAVRAAVATGMVVPPRSGS